MRSRCLTRSTRRWRIRSGTSAITASNPRRVVFQGVHMMMGGDMGKPWGKDKKQSVMVFIGKKLPKDLFLAGLEECLA